MEVNVMKKYNHAYDIAFEVISNKEDGSDVTADMLEDALRARIRNFYENEIIECCGCPFDTYEMEEPKARRSSEYIDRLKVRT
jgi:hypothetical protein